MANNFKIKKVDIDERGVLSNYIINGNNIEKEKITIVDSIMGSGKTSWAIEKLKNENGKVIYITPFNNEIERVKVSLGDTKCLYEPNIKNKHGSKTYDFYNLLKNGQDIIATHCLFTNCSKEILDYFKIHDYTLILDEVMNVLQIEEISKADYEMLLKTNTISIDEEDGKVNWLDVDYEGEFSRIMDFAIAGQLYKHTSQDTDKSAFFVWQFPVEVFKYFKEVYILTYLFNGQIQKYYFDFHGLKYKYKQVDIINGKYTLVDYVKENEFKYLSRVRELINVYDGKLNNIGSGCYNFSVNYFRKTQNRKMIKQLKKNTVNYFQHIVKGKSAYNMWTVFQDHRNNLKGKGYTNGFIAVNARATNKYANKNNLAYLANRFLNTYISNYFKSMDIEIDEDLWALSELVQWIWRSAIRNNQAINIYIPSIRMRDLLISWLNYDEENRDEVS